MTDDISESYVTLVQVLADDAPLREWFDSLTHLAENRRHSELGRVAARFGQDGRVDLARLMMPLNDMAIYRAVARAVSALRD